MNSQFFFLPCLDEFTIMTEDLLLYEYKCMTFDCLYARRTFFISINFMQISV